jgi:membrane-associated phospholipid phosphatase
VVWARGDAAEVSRFWVAVLVAGYACYVSLPWLVSRPPRLCDQACRSANQVGQVNVFVLRRVSHELNTFPSGHVAVSCAAAAMLAAVSPATALIFGVITTLIAVGAVVGRYHYVTDVLFAVAVAVVAIAVGVLL